MTMNILERQTDIYGLSLFGIWTVLLAAVWIFILYDRKMGRNATSRPLQATTNEKGGAMP